MPFKDPERAREFNREQMRKRRANDPEGRRKYERDYARGARKRNPNIAHVARLRRMGLAAVEFDAMLVEQEGCCAICREFLETPNIDHDHSCCPMGRACAKCVRGLLCDHCNRGLGCFRDSPLLLTTTINYLQGPR